MDLARRVIGILSGCANTRRECAVAVLGSSLCASGCTHTVMRASLHDPGSLPKQVERPDASARYEATVARS
jgi:hypothetical protein